MNDNFYIGMIGLTVARPVDTVKVQMQLHQGKSIFQTFSEGLTKSDSLKFRKKKELGIKNHSLCQIGTPH